MKDPVWADASTGSKQTKPKHAMKTNIQTKQLFLNDFRAMTRRIRRAGLALTLCLFGFLLPARGQDPRLTNTNNPMDTNVSLGATVSFAVSATSTNGPMTRQWQHRDHAWRHEHNPGHHQRHGRPCR